VEIQCTFAQIRYLPGDTIYTHLIPGVAVHRYGISLEIQYTYVWIHTYM